jgi:hypothetical protein
VNVKINLRCTQKERTNRKAFDAIDSHSENEKCSRLCNVLLSLLYIFSKTLSKMMDRISLFSRLKGKIN